MSIATKTGDQGQTSLMYGRRIPKDHPRVEAYGTIDELNAYLGVARSCSNNPWVSEQLLTTQKELVALMGELAVADEDTTKYQAAQYPKLTTTMLERLDQVVQEIEGQSIRFEGWATPGETPFSAALDVARTICRRAERRVSTLQQQTPSVRPLTLQYLNRLSDALWLMARFVETRSLK